MTCILRKLLWKRCILKLPLFLKAGCIIRNPFFQFLNFSCIFLLLILILLRSGIQHGTFIQTFFKLFRIGIQPQNTCIQTILNSFIICQLQLLLYGGSFLCLCPEQPFDIPDIITDLIHILKQILLTHLEIS